MPRYAVVYRNNPIYKGNDLYVKEPLLYTQNKAEAFLFKEKSDGVEYAKNNPILDYAHLEAVVVPVKCWSDILLCDLVSLFNEYEQFNQDEREDGLIIHTDVFDDLLDWYKNEVST